MIADTKKQEWLRRTNNVMALELLEKSLTKHAEQSETAQLLFKETGETEMEQTTTEVVNTEVPVVEETANTEVVTTEEVVVTDNVTAEPAKTINLDETLLTVLEPLVKAIEQINARMNTLEKAYVAKQAQTDALLPIAATNAQTILKDRLSSMLGDVNTFVFEAPTTLQKDKPVENSVLPTEKTEAESLFNGFLMGL